MLIALPVAAAATANKEGGRSSNATKPTAKKKARKTPGKSNKKPEDMPRRPLSAYNIFFREQREVILAERNEAKDKGDGVVSSPGDLFSQLGKTVAKRWKELTPTRRKRLEELAKEEMVRYRSEMAEYNRKRATQAKAQTEALERVQQRLDNDSAAMAELVSSNRVDAFRSPSAQLLQDSLIPWPSSTVAAPSAAEVGSAYFGATGIDNQLGSYTGLLQSLTEDQLDRQASLLFNPRNTAAGVTDQQVDLAMQQMGGYNDPSLQGNLSMVHRPGGSQLRNDYPLGLPNELRDQLQRMLYEDTLIRSSSQQSQTMATATGHQPFPSGTLNEALLLAQLQNPMTAGGGPALTELQFLQLQQSLHDHRTRSHHELALAQRELQHRAEHDQLRAAMFMAQAPNPAGARGMIGSPGGNTNPARPTDPSQPGSFGDRGDTNDPWKNSRP